MTSQELRSVAEEWVTETHGPEMAMVPEVIFEDDSYFIFGWSSRQFLDTGDPCYAIMGNGPVVINKRDGRIFEYGSGAMGGGIEALVQYQRDRDVRETVLRRRFPEYDSRKNYRVRILKVYDADRLLSLLDSFKLKYMLPEIESGTIWRVAKRYDTKLLQERLSGPMPITFGYAGKAGRVDYLYELVTSDENKKLCDITIEEYKIPDGRIHDSSKAKPEEMEPEW